MSLTEKINNDIKAAMLAKESRKLEALRAVKAALLLEMTKGTDSKVISEENENRLLQKLVKQRKEAGEIYKSKNRMDLADEEFYQATVIEAYLPEQMDPEKVRQIISAIITTSGATGMQDMGKVMGMATKELAGKADGKAISQVVKKLLS